METMHRRRPGSLLYLAVPELVEGLVLPVLGDVAAALVDLALRDVGDAAALLLRELPVDDVEVLLHAGLVEALDDEAVALLVHPPQAHLRHGPAPGLGDVAQDGGVHHGAAAPVRALGAQRRVRHQLDALLPAELPQRPLLPDDVDLDLFVALRCGTHDRPDS
jgi:hypothetical protein